MFLVGRLGVAMEKSAKLDRLGDDALHQCLEPIGADHLMRLTHPKLGARVTSVIAVGPNFEEAHS